MSTRALLRHIALGLPLLGAPIGGVALGLTLGCACGGPCGQTVRTRNLTSEETAVYTSAGSPSSGMLCNDVCNGASVVDGGGDAGTTSGETGWMCATTGAMQVECRIQRFCGGRAPAGLVMDETRARGVGELFARSAYLEAAAVPAFVELADELARHGAPASLVRGARRAASDERRHARTMRALAARFSGVVRPVERAPHAPRSLFEIADDNAFEGCVREAYGAVIAAYQAEHASDAGVRRAHRTIAKDEARHALLSLSLHDWAKAQLTARRARTIDETRARGARSMREEAQVEPTEDIRRIAGMPPAAVATVLASQLSVRG